MSDFKAKMHQNPKFGWGSAPDPLAGFKGPTSKGRRGQGSGEEGRGGEGGSVVESKKILKIDPARLRAPLLGTSILTPSSFASARVLLVF